MEVTIPEQLETVLRQLNIANVLKYVDEGMELAIIFVRRSAMVVMVVVYASLHARKIQYLSCSITLIRSAKPPSPEYSDRTR